MTALGRAGGTGTATSGGPGRAAAARRRLTGLIAAAAVIAVAAAWGSSFGQGAAGRIGGIVLM